MSFYHSKKVSGLFREDALMLFYFLLIELLLHATWQQIKQQMT